MKYELNNLLRACKEENKMIQQARAYIKTEEKNEKKRMNS